MVTSKKVIHGLEWSRLDIAASWADENIRRGHSVYLTIPRSEIFLSWVSLPSLDAKAIEDAVEKEFPLPKDQLLWAIRAGRPPGESVSLRGSPKGDRSNLLFKKKSPLAIPGKTDCFASLAMTRFRRDDGSLQREMVTTKKNLLAALPKARAEEYTKTLSAAGLRLEGIALNFEAQYKACRAVAPVPDGGVILLDPGATKTEASFFYKDVPLFCRELAGGMDNGAALQEELAATAAYVIKEWADFKAEQCWILNRPALSPAALDLLKKKWAGVFGDVSLLPVPSLPTLSADSGDLGKEELWFRPHGLSTSVIRQIWRTQDTNILAGVSVALVLASIWLNGAVEKAQLDVNRLTKEAARLTGGDYLSSRLTSATNKDSSLDILVNVLQQVPKSTCLLEYTFDAGQKSLSLRGRTAEYAHVSQFLLDLSRQPAFAEVKGGKSALTPMGDRSVVDFSLEARLQ